MGTIHPERRDLFERHLRLAQEEVAQGVVDSRNAAADAHWDLWCKYCTELGVDPALQDRQHRIPLLQVFAHRYRHGIISPSGNQVRARTVEDAIRSIAQTFKALGTPDPRHDASGSIDFRLQRMLRGYKRQDPPPNRVKPIPVNILHTLVKAVTEQDLVPPKAVADMITIAFFFLLRPGEYLGSSKDTTPFALQDVEFHVGRQRYPARTATIAQIRPATFVTLEFTTQKNGVKGEVVGLSASGDPHFCPVKALVRRIAHLKQHNAPPTMPLGTYYQQQTPQPVTSTAVTTALKNIVALLGPQQGLHPRHVTARSLRASGAMALLCSGVDNNVIQLLGRWRSDEMLRYLHVQAEPLTRTLAKGMLLQGNYALLPNSDIPVPHHYGDVPFAIHDTDVPLY